MDCLMNFINFWRKSMKKRIIYFSGFLISLGIIGTSIADDLYCPDDIICTNPSDLSSCSCRFNKNKTNDWVVTIDGDEGAYVMRGTYTFHNATVNFSGNKTTKTSCVYTYFTDPHSEARLVCRANASNLMPVLNADTMWQLVYNNSLDYVCGNYNQGADKQKCPLK